MSFNLLPEESILACSLTFAYFLFSSHSPESWHCFSVWSIAWKWNFWTFLLNNSKIQHLVFLSLSSEIIYKFWSNVAKTVQRLQMDFEKMRFVRSCFSFVQSCRASRSWLQNAEPSSAGRERLCIEAGNEKHEPGFHFPACHSWGTDCSLATGIQLWKEPCETRREATNELNVVEWEEKNRFMFLGSCHDYYRMKKKNVQFINSLINELSSCLCLPSEYRDFYKDKEEVQVFLSRHLKKSICC